MINYFPRFGRPRHSEFVNVAVERTVTYFGRRVWLTRWFVEGEIRVIEKHNSLVG